MNLLSNRWFILAAVVALGTSHTLAYVKGSAAKENAILAEQKRQDELVRRIEETTAGAIAKIKVEHRTIKQEVQREILEKPVYRDCRSGPDGVHLYERAAGYAESARSDELPATGEAP